MKNALLLLAACFVVIASCKKKGMQTGCYYCVANDSTTSTDPTFNNPHDPKAGYISGEKCDKTNDQINSLVKENTKTDTIYNNGVMVIDHWTYSCQFDQ